MLDDEGRNGRDLYLLVSNSLSDVSTRASSVGTITKAIETVDDDRGVAAALHSGLPIV